MKIFSYVVTRDFGFAPNPFFGYCTLATCKPDIRKAAKIGDWIVGTGSKQKDAENQLIYAMQVTKILTFQQYWDDSRFANKRPKFNAALKHAYGDNIYHRQSEEEQWTQEDSHHSLNDGLLNEKNLIRDTSKTINVLISEKFAYWGDQGPTIPDELNNSNGEALRKIGPGHKSVCFSDDFIERFIDWFNSLKQQGPLEHPGDWNFNQ